MAILGKNQVILALGGGGSRGLAHLGVLQVLEESDIPIHGVIGTSVGAIVGASYARNPHAAELVPSILEYLRSDKFKNDHFKRMMFGANEVEQNFAQTIVTAIRKSFNFTSLIRRRSIFEGNRLREAIDDIIGGDCNFNALKLPFAVPAIDLRPPQEVLLTSGSVLDAVVASCSLPGFFPPVELDGMLLADVGVIGSVPIEAAKEFMPGALVVAVDLSTELQPISDIERGWDSILRTESIASSKLNQIELERADVVIRPEIGEKYWSDFSELQRMVDAGRKAAEDMVPTIKHHMKSWLRFIRK